MDSSSWQPRGSSANAARSAALRSAAMISCSIVEPAGRAASGPPAAGPLVCRRAARRTRMHSRLVVVASQPGSAAGSRRLPMFSTSSSQTLWPTSSMSWRLSWQRAQIDHTSGAYRSMSSFHASWSPSPTRPTRVTTDGSSRIACPFQGPAGPAWPHRSRCLPAILLVIPLFPVSRAAATHQYGVSSPPSDTPWSAAAHDLVSGGARRGRRNRPRVAAGRRGHQLNRVRETAAARPAARRRSCCRRVLCVACRVVVGREKPDPLVKRDHAGHVHVCLPGDGVDVLDGKRTGGLAAPGVQRHELAALTSASRALISKTSESPKRTVATRWPWTSRLT